MELKPYQIEVIDKLRHNVLALKSTWNIICQEGGTGKTVISVFTCKSFLEKNKNKKALFVVPMEELLMQAYKTYVQFGIKPYIYRQTEPPPPHARMVIASVQTMRSRGFFDADIVFVDECHLGLYPAMLQWYKDNPKEGRIVVGLSATPADNSVNRLSEFYDYDNMIMGKHPAEHVADGELVKDKIYIGKIVDVDFSKIPKRKTEFGLEYNEAKMYELLNKSIFYNEVVRMYKDKAYAKRAICFNLNVEHSKQMAQVFQQHGISAVHLDGNTPKGERAHIINNFKSGLFRVLCVVGIATYGYDDKSLDTIIVNRKVSSNALWRQMILRGDRVYPGKNEFIVLDPFRNAIIHGGLLDRPDYKARTDADDNEKKGVKISKECPSCELIVPVATRICPECGHIFKINTQESPNVDALKLDLELLDDAKQTQPKKEKALSGFFKTLYSINDEARRRQYAESYAREKGYKSGWVNNLLKNSKAFKSFKN